jgi:hypothetical protein
MSKILNYKDFPNESITFYKLLINEIYTQACALITQNDPRLPVKVASQFSELPLSYYESVISIVNLDLTIKEAIKQWEEHYSNIMIPHSDIILEAIHRILLGEDLNESLIHNFKQRMEFCETFNLLP